MIDQCCGLGFAWFMESGFQCGPFNGVLSDTVQEFEDECRMMANICCMKKKKEDNCALGMDNAQNGQSCIEMGGLPLNPQSMVSILNLLAHHFTVSSLSHISHSLFRSAASAVSWARQPEKVACPVMSFPGTAVAAAERLSWPAAKTPRWLQSALYLRFLLVS